MPIVVHLDRLLYERELSLTELSERVGLTLANLSILKTGKARAIRFSTLEMICGELGCQPGDLLEHVPSHDPAANTLRTASDRRPVPLRDERSD